jgi:hypothetical protein
MAGLNSVGAFFKKAQAGIKSAASGVNGPEAVKMAAGVKQMASKMITGSKVPKSMAVLAGLGMAVGTGTAFVKGGIGTAKDISQTIGLPAGFAVDYSTSSTFNKNPNIQSQKKRLQASTYNLVQSTSSGKSSVMRSIRR